MKKAIPLIFLICNTLFSFGQTPAIDKFAEENKEGFQYFLYQSTLRMLNGDNNPDFNELIQDLEYIKIVSSDSLGNQAKSVYKDLQRSLVSESFEELYMSESKGVLASIYMREADRGKTDWFALVTSNGYTLFFSMKGELDLNYISAISSLDHKQLTNMIGDKIKIGAD